MTEAVEPGQIQVDFQRVINSLSRQLAEQAQQIAVKDAIIEMQQEEIGQMRRVLDSVPKSDDEVRTQKKGKK